MALGDHLRVSLVAAMSHLDALMFSDVQLHMCHRLGLQGQGSH